MVIGVDIDNFALGEDMTIHAQEGAQLRDGLSAGMAEDSSQATTRSGNRIVSGYMRFSERIEKYLTLLTVGAFIGGIFLAAAWPPASRLISDAISRFVDFYGFIAPVAIYAILAPALARMMGASSGRGGAFAGFAIYWLSVRRFISLIWAVAFTVVVFGLPLFSTGGATVYESIIKTLRSLGWMMMHSTYFYAMYLSVITVLVSRKVPRVSRVLDRCAVAVEVAGQAFVPLVPLFMLAVGAYIYALPENLKAQIGSGAEGAVLKPLWILGWEIPSNTPLGIVACYVAISFLIGVACIMWQGVLLGIVKRKNPSFSIGNYFRNYWLNVYPLLWATSSEALATPLNLYLVKKYFPQIRTEVRRFVIGVGSYLNINGTMICVIVLLGAVVRMLGIPVSMVDLLLVVPLVFLIGFGVPGIPGELLLFAGPIVTLLGFPEATSVAFLALYLGLQLGLPDSFRTGNNSTDDCVMAVLLNRYYEERFASLDQLDEEYEDIEESYGTGGRAAPTGLTEQEAAPGPVSSLVRD